MVGLLASSPRTTSAYAAPSGQAMPNASADRRNDCTVASSGGGIVRSNPIPASSISRAADMPVSNDICAFQSSTGSGARYVSVQPVPLPLTCCSGTAKDTAPRARSRSSRS